MTGPLARLRAIAAAVAAWCNPDRVTCGWVNETHEPLDESDN